MKKFLLSLVALVGFGGMALAGNGSAESPYSVDELIEKGKPASAVANVWVQGYIVGSVDGQVYASGCNFSLNNASNTNILIASTPQETDPSWAMPVQLPAGAVRNALSIQQNPNNLGHEVILCGSWEAYFGTNGLKFISEYKWVGDAPVPGGGSTGGNTGGNADGALLVDNMDNFEIYDVTLTEPLTYVWTWDAQYGAKASAYFESTNYAAESYLISPVLKVPADVPSATFSQALNYLSGANRADHVNVCVREGEGEWTVAEVSKWPAGSDWGFIDDCTIDLSAYAGKDIQIAFQYKSSSTTAPTWEVKRLKMGAKATETPSTPGADSQLTGDCVAFVADGYAYSGKATQTVVLSGTQEAGSTINDTNWTAGGVCTLDFTNNNSSISWVTGGVVRWYKGDAITITPLDGQAIIGLRMVSGATNPVVTNGVANLEPVNGRNWTVISDTEAEWVGSMSEAFTFANTAQVRFQYLEVYYGEGYDDPGQDNPTTPIESISVAEALQKITSGYEGKLTVKGYISQVKEISTQYGNASYYIVDDMNSTANALYVYRGYWLDGAKFTSENQLVEGALVIVSGDVENYMGNTPEMKPGNVILSYSVNGETPDVPTPDVPTGDSVTFDFTVPSSLGDFTDEVSDGAEQILTGITVTNAPASILFEANESASTQPRFYCSNKGEWTMRFYNNTSMTVKVEDGYRLLYIQFDGTNVAGWTLSNGALNGNTWAASGWTNTVVIGKDTNGQNPAIRSMKVYYTEADGVDSVITADGEAVYYNLQGVKVNNPEKGIFVKVQGGKAVKVVK